MVRYRLILFFAFILELGFLTFCRGIAGPYVSSLLLLFTSLFIGIYPLFIYSGLTIKSPSKKNSVPLWYKTAVIVPLIIICTFLTITILSPLVKMYPVDTDLSGIYPTIRIMNERLMNFEFPYKLIPEMGNLQPSLMPFQWIPFLLGNLFDIDYRWVSFIFWLAGTLFYEYRLFRKEIGMLQLILLSILPFVILLVFIKFHPEAFISNIELLMAGFYMILCLSLLYNSMYIRVTGIVLTLLSRFVNLLWIPLYLAVTFFVEKKQRAIILGGSMLCGVVLFYAIPFLSQNTMIFQQGQKFRTKAAIAEWKIKDSTSLTHKPAILYKGVGVACFFYDFKKGDIAKKVKAQQKFHLIFSILSILVLTIIFLIYQDTINHKIFNLMSLKIHLAIFFNFYQVPQAFLFLIPLFISLIIFAEMYGMTKKQ